VYHPVAALAVLYCSPILASLHLLSNSVKVLREFPCDLSVLSACGAILCHISIPQRHKGRTEQNYKLSRYLSAQNFLSRVALM